MVLINSIREYMNKMLGDISGMKVLVLDPQTLAIVSVATSQSELLQKEVFLVETADNKVNESMMHLKAVCFLRPTMENMQNLKQMLAHPRFGEYHLFFSNILKTNFISNLADFDQHEAVQQVQEFFGDFIALDPYHFTLNVPSNHHYMLPLLFDPAKLQPLCDRVVEGITSVFLALKKRPLIRYSRNSEIATRIAQDCSKLMFEQEAALFDFRRTEVMPLLLIIDRRDDPVTPLLNQWTYQAMVHELIGIKDNKVDLKDFPRVPKDQQEVVLSSEQDPFFKSNMFENFGDLGMNVKKMVDSFQSHTKSNQNIQSIEDMVKFVENYPEFRKMQGNVSKHVSMMTELSRIVDERKLMSVSQAEQELACHSSQAVGLEELNNQWELPGVTDEEKLRLVMLYGLRYEKENPQQLQQLVTKLNTTRSKYNSHLLYSLLKQAGEQKRTGDLFSNRDLFNRARVMARGLKGVENVYTQHQPLLFHIIDSILRGRLKDADYPVVAGNHNQQGKPQDVVIFIVGGTTYAESRVVAMQNAANPGTRIMLGGTVVHNSSSFLGDLEEIQRVGRASIF